MEFLYVPGGWFKMGDTFGDGESNEKPVHDVHLYIVGFPVLENNKEKVFIEFQAYEYPFIKYNLASKVLMTYAQDNDNGKVSAVIIYTEQKYMDAALSIHAFGKLAEAQFDC